MDRLRSMQVFERVADEGGFAPAARALDMSPPVVTRLVAELEAHLGARLFQRTTRRVALTDAGTEYLQRVRKILRDVDEAEVLANEHSNALSGRLRVYTLPVLASYVVAPVLPSFRQQYPGIMVDIEVGNQKEGALEDFDITLLGADANFDGSVIARKVAESEVILVASPAYVERKGAPQTPEDLLRHDCLRLKNDDGQLWPWRMWSDQQREEDVEVDAVLVANHTDTLLRATLDGVGITSMSVDIAAPYLNRGELIRVLSPWSTGRVAMFAALPSRKFIPRRTRVFLDYFVDYTRAQSKKALAACEAC